MGRRKKVSNGHHPTTRLFPYKQYWTFQGYYKVKSEAGAGLTTDEVFSKCILHIMKWVKDRTEKDRKKNYIAWKDELAFLEQYPNPKDYAGFELFSDEDRIISHRSKKRYDVSFFAFKDEDTWTIRIIEPNSERKNKDGTRKRIMRERVFITNAAVKKGKDGVYLTTRITCKEPEDNLGDASAYRPAYLYYIYEDPALRMTEGGLESWDYPMDGRVIPLNTKSDVDCKHLCEDLLYSEYRQHPVVLAPKSEDARVVSKINDLARRTAGLAYFVREDVLRNYAKLFLAMGREDILNKNRIGEGYCLLLYPGKDCKSEWYLTNANEIKKLEQALRIYTVRRDGVEYSPGYKYGDVLFYSSLWDKYVKNVEAAAEYELFEEVKEELKEELDPKKNEELMKKLNEIEENFFLINKENTQIKEKNKNLQNLYNDECGKLRDRIKELENGIKQNNSNSSEDVNAAVKNANDLRLFVDEYLKPYIKVIAGPGKREEVIPWIKNNFSETIEVHRDAEDAYEKHSSNSPVDVVCKCVIYLSAYVKLERGDISLEQFTALGNSEVLSAVHSASVKGAEAFHEIEHRLKSGLTKKITAAVIRHDGEDKILDKHIRCSIGNDGGTTRVYFFYDEKTKKAVIGYMPDHLQDGSGHNNRSKKA